MTHPKICERCHKNPSIVGWGTPPIWLCTHCFDNALKDVAKILQRLTTPPRPPLEHPATPSPAESRRHSPKSSSQEA